MTDNDYPDAVYEHFKAISEAFSLGDLNLALELLASPPPGLIAGEYPKDKAHDRND